MTMDVIYKERGSDWSHQVSAVGTTRWLQHDHTLPLDLVHQTIFSRERVGSGDKTAESPGRPQYQLKVVKLKFIIASNKHSQVSSLIPRGIMQMHQY